jgi:hypothetical protein
MSTPMFRNSGGCEYVNKVHLDLGSQSRDIFAFICKAVIGSQWISNIITNSNFQAAIALSHRDNGIENYSFCVPLGLQTRPYSFSVAMSVIHSQHKSRQRCPSSRAFPNLKAHILGNRPMQLLTSSISIETPRKTMRTSPSSSLSRTTSSLKKSSSAIHHNIRKLLLCLYWI